MLRRYWQVACPSSRLGAAPLATRICGEQLVLFRCDGAPRALPDRCPHFGAELSRGCVDSGAIVCPYHGRRFGADGRGAAPSGATVPGAKTFACCEADGYVWVLLEGSPAAIAAPRIPELSHHRWLQGTSTLRCNYMRALDNTFDESHVFFAHPMHPAAAAWRSCGQAPVLVELRQTTDGCLAFSPPAPTPGDPVPDASKVTEFRLPYVVRYAVPYCGMYLYFHIVPEGERSTRIEWLMTNPDPDAPHIQWCETNAVVAEDRAILEALQRTYDREGEGFEHSATIDAMHLLMRRVVRSAEAGRWGQGPQRLPAPRHLWSMAPKPQF